MKYLPSIICFVLFTVSCSNPGKARKEILQVEKDFMSEVASKGIRDAFVYYADEQAVLIRDNQLIRGKAAIADFYERSSLKNSKLTWTPEFIEVSGCGDLAYTWGRYVYTATDSAGRESTQGGIFHTVWKRQPDGNWKYVYD